MYTRILTLSLALIFCFSSIAQVTPSYTEEDISTAMADYAQIEHLVDKRVELNAGVPTLAGAAGFVLWNLHTRKQQAAALERYFEERLFVETLQGYSLSLRMFLEKLDDLKANIDTVLPKIIFERNVTNQVTRSNAYLSTTIDTLSKQILETRLEVLINQSYPWLQQQAKKLTIIDIKFPARIIEGSKAIAQQRLHESIFHRIHPELDNWMAGMERMQGIFKLEKSKNNPGVYKAALNSLRELYLTDEIFLNIETINREIKLVIQANSVERIEQLVAEHPFLLNEKTQALIKKRLTTGRAFTDLIAKGLNNESNTSTLNEVAIKRKWRMLENVDIRSWSLGKKTLLATVAVAAVAALGYGIYKYFSTSEEANHTTELFNSFINGDAATKRAILKKHPEAIEYIQEIKGSLI